MNSHSPEGRVGTSVRWSIYDAIGGTFLAVVLVSIVALGLQRSWFGIGAWPSAVSYLSAWLPLIGSVALASYYRGQQSLRRDFGLSFTLLDVILGLALGLFLRSLATLIEVAFYGRPVSGGVTFESAPQNILWVLFSIIAPVLIAPFVEELFFRGLLQRAVLKAVSPSKSSSTSRLATVIAVAVSSLVFAAVHVLQTGGGAQTIVVGISTLILGVGLGALAAATGRLGGAIIAHVVFNGLGVLAMLV